MDTTKISGTWDKVWINPINLETWDYLSQVVYETLAIEIGSLQNKKIIEVGSGSGRISNRLAKDGAEVTLLDISSQAIEEEKRLFRETNVPGKIIKGSLFEIPCLKSSHDVVWNSGVVEHYLDQELLSALREMARVSKYDGKVVVIVPYAGSFLHTLGKAFIEIFVEYPFGGEYPIKTLKSELRLISCDFIKKEYSVGFFVLLVGAFKRLMLLKGGVIFKPFYHLLNRLFLYLSSESSLAENLRKWDLKFSKLFGGYLLVSVFRKREA